jgi:hypothetical protein
MKYTEELISLTRKLHYYQRRMDPRALPLPEASPERQDDAPGTVPPSTGKHI